MNIYFPAAKKILLLFIEGNFHGGKEFFCGRKIDIHIKFPTKWKMLHGRKIDLHVSLITLLQIIYARVKFLQS